jgi:hypothetical protein
MWTGRKYHGGYGYFKYQNRQLAAHRVAFHLRYGGCNLDLQLNHCCVERSTGSRIDRPACVNPDHLYEGTERDNMQDALKRNSVGKLSFNDATNIRDRYHNGESSKSLSIEYDVTDAQIRVIVNNKSWKDNNYTGRVSKDRSRRTRIELKPVKVDELKQKFLKGVPKKELCKEYKISYKYCRELTYGLSKSRITKTELKKLSVEDRKEQKEMLGEKIRQEFAQSELSVAQTIYGLMEKYNLGHYQIHKILKPCFT